MSQERYRQLLLKQLEQGHLALFIGADLPREVTGLPSRADLARELARRKELEQTLSLAEVAQRVSQAGNRFEFTAFIRDQLDTTGKPPQPFHRRIVALVQEHEIETLITTAHDNLLELAFQEAGIGINRVVRGSDVSFIVRDRPTLIKLYGDAQQPDTLVVTADDHYGLWRDRDKEDLLHEVRTVLRRHTVLFLGYNLADPDFNLLWREVLDRAGRFARTAYAVWPHLPEGEVRMWRDRGIFILDIEPLGFLERTLVTPNPRLSARPTAAELRQFVEEDFRQLEDALNDVRVAITGESPLVKRSATSNWDCINSRSADMPKDIHIAFDKVVEVRERARRRTTRLTSEQMCLAKQAIRQILEFLHEQFPAAGVNLLSSSAQVAVQTAGLHISPSSLGGGNMDYERGLDALKRLAQGADWYQDFTVHEASLRENLRDERRYGPSEQTRRDRTRVVDQLNALALEHLGISFNDLCLNKQLPPKLQLWVAALAESGSDSELPGLVDVLSIHPEHDGRPHKAGPAQWFSRLRIESRTPIHGCWGKIYEIRRLDGPDDQQGAPLPESHASCLSWGSRGRSGVFEPISIQPKDTEYLDLVWRAHGDPPIPENQLRVASALDHGERNTSSSDWGKRQDFIPLGPGYYLLVVQVWADGYNIPVECTYRLHWPGSGQEDDIRLVEIVGSQGPKGDGGETSPAPLYGAGNRWAVVVGVNEYEDKANYGQLHVCVKDVHAIREQLIAGGFDPNRIRLLADETGELPTKANILVALKAVADATEPDDLLLFYYSGHGDEEGGESYLVARDGRRLVLGDTAVPLSRVREIVEGASARAKVIMLDACHSGADIGGKGPKPMSEEFIRRVFEQAEGLAIVASCKQGQLSYEWREHERSAFTHYLLEALEGQADRDEKGFVTVQDANRHVTNGVKLWASQRNLGQTPTLQYTVAGDIILIRYQE